jgi:hypothetical protein
MDISGVRWLGTFLGLSFGLVKMPSVHVDPVHRGGGSIS